MNLINFNIVIESFSVLFCLFGILMIFVGTKMEPKTRLFFSCIVVSNMLSVVSNLLGLLFKGDTGRFARVIIPIVNFSEFFFAYLLSAVFTLYLLFTLGIKIKGNKKIGLLAGYFTVEVLLLVVSQFNGMYYYHDDANVYHRGSWFWLSQAVGIVLLIADAVILIRYRKRLAPKEKFAFWIYILLPAAALIVQLFAYGVYLLLITTSVSIMTMFVLIMMAQVERYCEKERQVSNLQADILLSQIQPHFLYNALTAIYRLCDSKPQKAKEAVSEFAKYLRGNLDSLKQNAPIPFADEFNHIKAYLALEKIRYDDDLEVVYDIKASEFFIPALTVQPLIENAVNHGISDLPHGGTVTLSTREFPDYYEIRVSDNGIGFDPDKLPQDGKSHIGISNVRSRIEMMCHGRLDIVSEAGKGTTATITIPKGV